MATSKSLQIELQMDKSNNKIKIYLGMEKWLSKVIRGVQNCLPWFQA